MNDEKDTINIYYSPRSTHELDSIGEWSMLYPDPKTLFDELAELRAPKAGPDTYFSCPATNHKYRNTLVFRSPMDASYEFDFSSENESDRYFINKSKSFISYEILRPPTIKLGPLVNFNLYYTVFSDEPVEAIFTPPMMHQPRYTTYGTCIPGQYDIGKWFRPFPMEIQMWNTKGEFHIEDGEPLLYIEFKTKKKINLIKYKMNGEIASYLSHCAQSKTIWGPGQSLEKRYERFENSSMKEQIIKAIEPQIIKKII